MDGTQVQGTPVEPHKRTNFFPGDKTLSDEDLFNIQRLENRFCYLPIQFLGIWWNGQILIRSGSIFKSKDGLIDSPG